MWVYFYCLFSLFISLWSFGSVPGMPGHGAFCVCRKPRGSGAGCPYSERKGAFSWSAGGAGTSHFAPGGDRGDWGQASVFTVTGYFWFAPTYRLQPFSKDSWDAYRGASSLHALTSGLPCTARLSKAGSRLLVSRLLSAAWILRLWSQETLADALGRKTRCAVLRLSCVVPFARGAWSHRFGLTWRS